MEGFFKDFPEFSNCKIPLKTAFIKGDREKFLGAVRANQVLVVMVENDFGNSNRILQYLYEDGSYTQSGTLIACTQPTSVAAKSSNNSIRFMTDVMLLREYLAHPDHAFVNYGVIMVDQAHERTVPTDLLLAFLKCLARVRPDLKLIISTSSVTHQTQNLSAYFDDAPVFAFPGEGNRVEILYTKETVTDYLDVAIDTALHIHAEYRDLPAGDILVFLPGVGQEEIESALVELSLNEIESEFESISLMNHSPVSRNWGEVIGTDQLIMCPIYEYGCSGMLQQPTPQGARRVFFATDDADVSSIGTNTSIKYVIDSGLCKLKSFDPRTGMESLVVGPISKESAWRRASAAVRGGLEGKCFRLYTQDHYLHGLEDFTLPEIQRTNLANVVLILKSLGVEDLSSFDFVDRPSSESLNKALDLLYALSALDRLGRLTQVGRRMADFFTLGDPMLSRMIVASESYSCSEEIITIAAMLSSARGDSIFYRPKGREAQADSAKMRFHEGNVGHHIPLLKAYNEWRSCDYGSVWCNDNYVKVRNMNKARDIRNQLEELMVRVGIELKSNLTDLAAIKRAITYGFSL